MEQQEQPKYLWAYGLTTVPSRIDNLFRTTLDSLKQAGFGFPRVFVDGVLDGEKREYLSSLQLDLTLREPGVGAYGNWIMTLWELHLRNPTADRFAIFQDDFSTYKNLRDYLESCTLEKKTYWNLYTFPSQQRRADETKGEGYTGWFPSTQMGKGAVALIFERDAVLDLLSSYHMAAKPRATRRPTTSIDGAVITALKEKGYTELCHTPSLVQHNGMHSTLGHHNQLKALSFYGEGVDACNLAQTKG